jgi:hypothetical protein
MDRLVAEELIQQPLRLCQAVQPLLRMKSAEAFTE